VIKIICANSLGFSLSKGLDECFKVLPPGHALKAKEGVLSFIADRLERMVLDEGFNYDIVRSAMAAGFDDLTDFRMRLEALRELSGREYWSDLVTVVERTYNIGKKVEVEGEVEASLLAEPEEKELWEVYGKNRERIMQLIAAREYVTASEDFEKTFSAVVHKFFDKVFVNVEDEALRNNRQRMLKKINLLYSEKIADLSRIVEKEK
jgi:glycyl-tRNA synthetase beta chain